MPVFGPLIRKIALAKFTRTFGTLVSAGVPILSALDIVADTAGNEVVADAVKKARTAIKEGETIAKPLSESKVFPSMLVQMIAVGEETGALDTMLNKIADFYDEEVATAVDGLTSLDRAVDDGVARRHRRWHGHRALPPDVPGHHPGQVVDRLSTNHEGPHLSGCGPFSVPRSAAIARLSAGVVRNFLRKSSQVRHDGVPIHRVSEQGGKRSLSCVPKWGRGGARS